MSEQEQPGLPGALRLAATGAWRASGWALETSARAGVRLLRVAASPETAPQLVDEVRATARTYIRELAGIAEGGVADAVPGRGREAEAPAPHEELAPLRDRAAEILHRSRDVNYTETAHPAYERILGDIAPDEARILRLLLLKGPQPAVDVRTGGPLGLLSSRLIAPGFSMIGARAGCRYPERVPGYLNNLFRLGMIWFSRETIRDPVRYQVLEAQPEVLEAIKSVRMAKVIRRSIHLTPFGEDFCRVCLAIEPTELVDLPEHAAPRATEKAALPPTPGASA